MSDGASILLTIAGTGIGAAIGAIASWHFSRTYYLRSGTDLDAALRPLAGDSGKQLQALAAIARMLEQAGIGKPAFDAAGNLTGVVITGALRAVAGSDGFRAVGTCTPPSQYDRQHEQPSASIDIQERGDA
jgi:hypothetical protein